MARAKIVEVDYYEFRTELTKAVAAGQRIEKSDPEKWRAYIRDNRVNEVSMLHWGKSKFESVDPVIIASGDWAGFYVYSEEEEAVLKWVWAEE